MIHNHLIPQIATNRFITFSASGGHDVFQKSLEKQLIYIFSR